MFYRNGSIVRQLIILKKIVLAAAEVVIRVVGTAPVALANAVSAAIVSLTQYGKCEQPAGVWNTAITQYGKCEQNGTPTPSVPVDIVTNNGALRYSANMANVNEQAALVGYYISAQGVVTADTNNWMYQAFIPVKPSTAYTLSFDTNVYYVTISEYATAEDSGFVVRKAGSSGSNTTLTVTTEATTNYIRFGTNINRSVVTLDQVLAVHWMLAQSATAMPYAPYVAPNGGIYVDGTPETLTISADGAETQTVNDVSTLLAVGTYADIEELVNGIRTGRVAVYVCTGADDEDWKNDNSTKHYLNLSDGLKTDTYIPAPCTRYKPTTHGWGALQPGEAHYDGSATHGCIDVCDTESLSLTAFKAKLAAWYSEGKPMMMLYPVADSTEQTTAYPQLVNAKYNTASVTAEVSGIQVTFTTGEQTTPNPYSPLPVVCNNGRVVAGNCISHIPDGQGTFVTPSELTTTRIYKAFPTDLVVGRSYTVTVTGTNWTIIVQRKKLDGTGSANVSGWVTTYAFAPEEGYIYGVAIQKTSGGSAVVITPADFDGTLTLDTTDGKPWADGTPEVLTVRGINLFDPTCIVPSTVGGITINAPTADGTITASGSTEITYEQFVFTLQNPLPAGKYTVSLNNSPALGNGALVGFGVGSATVGDRGTGLRDVNNSKVITIPDGSSADRIIIRLNGDLSAWSMKIQVEAGEVTPSAYEPYVTPQTVTGISNLLAVGDYADAEELIAGIKTGGVGVKVLTGDNTKDGLWGTSAGASNLYSLTIADSSTDNTFSPISTHFVGVLGNVGYASIQDGQFKHGSNSNAYYFKDKSSEDVTAFKAFLAAQYAAGTPVIVLYPLAVETTEQTTAHALNTTEGTNVVSVTANVSDITLEVQYKGTEA